MKDVKKVIRLWRAMDRIVSIAFIFLMVYLWFYLDCLTDFLVVSIPTTIIFGWMQGNSVLLSKVFEKVNQ